MKISKTNFSIIKIAITLILIIVIYNPQILKADFYYNSGNITQTQNWGINPDGSGSHPADFMQNQNYFVGAGKSAVVSSNYWNVMNLRISGGGTLQSDQPVTIFGTFKIDSNGTYIHNNTELVNISIFRGIEDLKPGSNFVVKKWSTAGEPIITNLGYNSDGYLFGNLEIDWQTGTGNWFQYFPAGQQNFCEGNFKLTSLGSAVFIPHSPNSTVVSVLNIKGDYIQSGGTIDLSMSSGLTQAIIHSQLSIYGNFNKSGGSIDASASAILGEINLYSNAKLNTFYNAGNINKIVFWLGGSYGAFKLLSDFPLSNNLPQYYYLNVSPFVTLDLGVNAITGAGGLNIGSGSVLKLGSPIGINGNITSTGQRIFAAGSTLEYNGTVPQITGDNMPSPTFRLRINNPNGVTVSKYFTVWDSLNFVSGKLNINNFDLMLGQFCYVGNFDQNRFINTTGTASLKKHLTGYSYLPVGNTTYNGVIIVPSAADTFSFRVQNTITNTPYNPAKVVNKEWIISATTRQSQTCQLSFIWNVTDEAASFNRAAATSIGKWNGSTYTTKTAYIYNFNPYPNHFTTYLTPQTVFSGFNTSRFVVGEDAGIINHYYYSSGDPASISSWGNAPGGNGTHPTGFDIHAYFNVEPGKTMQVTTPLNLTDANASLIIQNGGVVNADGPIYVNGTFTIKDGGTYNHNNTTVAATSCFKGTENFEQNSNINILKWSSTSDKIITGVNFSPTNYLFGNLTLNIAGMAGDWNQGWNGSYFLTKGNFRIQNIGNATFIPAAPGNSFVDLFCVGNIIVDTLVKVDLSKGSTKPATDIATRVEIGTGFVNNGGIITSTGPSRGQLWFYASKMHTIYNTGTLSNLGTMANPNRCSWLDSVKLNSNVVIAGSNTFFQMDGNLDCDNYGFGGDMNFQLTSGAKMKFKHPQGFDGVFAINGYKDIQANTTIEMNGTTHQITGVNNPFVVYNFIINNPAGVTLNGDFLVEDTLRLVRGIVTTELNPYASLQLDVNAIVLGASDSTFVSGPFSKIVESTAPFTMPIGKGNKFRPMTITPVTNNYVSFQAEYFDTVYQYMLPLEDSLTGICQSGYYYVTTPNTYSYGHKFTLSWNDDKAVTDLSKLRVANWNGEGWYNMGNTGTTGTIQSGTVRSVASTFTGVLAVGTIGGTLPVTSILNVTSIIEGIYNSNSNQQSKRDTLKAYLRSSTAPYSLVDSAKGVIDSLTHSGKFVFKNAQSGNYYLVLKHRNSIETWSKAGGINFINGSANAYDFTTAASQAYGNNLKQKGSKHCLFSGDVTQDGIIDVSDLVTIHNDQINFATGYLNSDVTGDDFVDVSDIVVAYNNAINIVSVVAP